MRKQLFFDDSRLFSKENLVRKQGKPTLIGEYTDPVNSADFVGGQVFRLPDGRYRMFYLAHSKQYGKHLYCAISQDGVHFEPENLYPDADQPNRVQIPTPQGHDVEIGAVYEDPVAEPAERYKLLVSDLNFEMLWIRDSVYVSPDLEHWSEKKGSFWGDGTEPLVSVFFNEKDGTHTIVERAFWGIRGAGYKTTRDWVTFSPYQECVKPDPLDEDLAEVYGMQAFAYDGMFIGLPHLYRGLHNEYNTKFNHGNIDTQLAYSYDGKYWLRGLREPFISGVDGSEPRRPMVWVSGMVRPGDGSIRFYAASTEKEHGPAFREPGTGKVLVYQLREDGFVSLASRDPAVPSSLSIRETLWKGSEACWNLKARHATMAVRVSGEDEQAKGGCNVLGATRPAEGFGHEDCIPFSGDSTCWVPQYKNGRTLADLAGKTLVLELRFTDGEVYSLSGDFTLLFNTQAARYRKFGVLPK